jgi:hypothetical protein
MASASFFLLVCQVGRLKLLQRGAQRGQQILLQELADLVPLGVHDSVDAKVQVSLVHLEHLLQLADQLLALVVVGGAHRLRFQA